MPRVKSDSGDSVKLTERVSEFTTRHGIIRVREVGDEVEAVQLARDRKVPASWVPVALFNQAHGVIGQMRERIDRRPL